MARRETSQALRREAVESRIRVRVQPNARSSEVLGFREGVLRLRVSAPPREGRANRALIELLSEALKVPQSNVRILRGHTSREKLVAIDGLGPEAVRGLLSR